MNKQLKKILVISSLFIFLFQGIGMYFILNVRQNRIRKEMESSIINGIPEEKILIFTFNDEELEGLRWQRKSEFQYEGKMYDVLKTVHKDNKILLYCVLDKMESKIFSELIELIYRELSGKSKHDGKSNSKSGISDQFIHRGKIELIKITFYKYLNFNYLCKWPIGHLSTVFLPPEK